MSSSTSKTPKQSVNGLNVGTWMPVEDDRLREAVAKHGTRWVVVASEVGTRNGDQCAKRWNENLNPELDHSPWCPVEDRILLHLVKLHGHNWKFIANKFFEKRAPLSLKNRNSYLKRRQKREEHARVSKRQSQLQIEPLPLTPGLHTAGLVGIPDMPMGTPVPYSMTAEFSPRHISSHGSPASLTEADMAKLTSRTNSTTDFAEMLNSWTSSASVDQSLEPDSNQAFSRISDVAGMESPMSFAPDQMDWPALLGDSVSYVLPQSSDVDMMINTGFDENPVPVSTMHGITARQGPTARSKDTVEYSLTCPKNKLKSLVQHLVDAAMPGAQALGIADEDQPMVLSLRLERL